MIEFQKVEKNIFWIFFVLTKIQHFFFLFWLITKQQPEYYTLKFGKFDIWLVAYHLILFNTKAKLQENEIKRYIKSEVFQIYELLVHY